MFVHDNDRFCLYLLSFQRNHSVVYNLFCLFWNIRAMKVVNELYIVNIEMCKQPETEENYVKNLNYKY